MLILLTREAPEGPDDDMEIVGVFLNEERAQAYADSQEPNLEWDVNPAFGIEDIGFGSDGGSGLGWRMQPVQEFGLVSIFDESEGS